MDYDDEEHLRVTKTPFNQLPEDEQVREMGKLHPNYPYEENGERINRAIAQLVPNKTDADYAQEIKEKIIAAYQPLFEVLQEADKRGFNVQSTVGKDFNGRFTFAQLQVVKVY